ncbi:hypothetical protein TNIN_306621 [Trichonephila inaurata madagascariensis]|uniref:Uncharacterized protein n=1 Tax=Trichonephila inaurata madagascariensis TaxID=2747483 RepID=A0A8X7C9C0_9ARAC|nr:hypothetical protein TNIN_306621 [Trichonephila inaurata madagascariensis]
MLRFKHFSAVRAKTKSEPNRTFVLLRSLIGIEKNLLNRLNRRIRIMFAHPTQTQSRKHQLLTQKFDGVFVTFGYKQHLMELNEMQDHSLIFRNGFLRDLSNTSRATFANIGWRFGTTLQTFPAKTTHKNK